MTWHRDSARIAAYRKVEVWTKNPQNTWFQMIGVTSIIQGEVGIAPNDVEMMKFHSTPPTETKENRTWRYLDD